MISRSLEYFASIIQVRADLMFFTYLFRLAEVGKLEPIKINGNYDTGQAFLHRLDGYRGVVLFPWTARVYDRDKRDAGR